LVTLLHLHPLLHTALTPPALHTLSLHDALPISVDRRSGHGRHQAQGAAGSAQAGRDRVPGPGLLAEPAAADRRVHRGAPLPAHQDRKSTRLNSSHVSTSYAVFCLKKKRTIGQTV